MIFILFSPYSCDIRPERYKHLFSFPFINCLIFRASELAFCSCSQFRNFLCLSQLVQRALFAFCYRFFITADKNSCMRFFAAISFCSVNLGNIPCWMHVCCGLILLLVENFFKPAHFFLTSLFFSNQEYNFKPAYLSTV